MEKKDQLCRAFLRGKISRRDFNASLLGLGLTAAAAGTIVSQTITKAQAATPERGGRIRVGSTASGPADTLDPHRSTSQPDILRTRLLYDRFVERDPQGNLLPAIAESWESNDTADEWVINLVQGNEFHNGKTVTSADAVYSLNRIQNPDTGSPARPLISDIAEAVADGPNRVILKLSQPNADMMQVLTEYHISIVPEGQDDYTGQPAGTAGWKVESFEPGIGSMFVRNENFRITDRPYIDEIELFGIPDPAARINALLSDEIDVTTNVDPQLITVVDESPVAHMVTAAGALHNTYPMRADTAPYTDVNVRLAMKSAIDRERYAELVFQGYAAPGRDHPVPSYNPMHCDDIPIPQFDPDKAKYYLKQAGQENTVFELSASDANGGGMNANLVLAEMANEAGINVKVKRVPTDGYWSDTWMKAPWSVSTWYGRPTAVMMLAVTYASTAPWNESYWKRPDFDALLKEASGTTDFDKRREILCAAQRMLAYEGSTVIPVFNNWIDARHDKVQDIVPNPDGFLGWLQWNDVWLKT